jgi:hypothetical protein
MRVHVSMDMTIHQTPTPVFIAPKYIRGPGHAEFARQFAGITAGSVTAKIILLILIVLPNLVLFVPPITGLCTSNRR